MQMDPNHNHDLIEKSGKRCKDDMICMAMWYRRTGKLQQAFSETRYESTDGGVTDFPIPGEPLLLRNFTEIATAAGTLVDSR